MVTEFIHLGDKVDIRLAQQMAQVEDIEVETHVYKSQVNDITEDGELEITMPIENGKVLLLHLGVRYEFVFYTETGLYHSIGQIKERYKRENIYVLLIELHSSLKKLQRREYYRHSCLMDVQFYTIFKEDIDTKTVEQIYQGLCNDNIKEKQKRGMILDLSGGGIRVVGDDKLESDSYLLLVLSLCNETMEKKYFIKGHVVTSEQMVNQQNRFETRIEFIFQDKKIQEEIIRYIFEQERKGRQRN